MKLISVIHDFNIMQQLLYKLPFCSYDPCNILHEKMVFLIKEMVSVSESDDMFIEARLYSILLEFFSLFTGRCKSEHIEDSTQTTFVDYLTKERIRKAETLFLGPNMKLIDIAYECGFTSSSSFNRTFKKVKGMSPKDSRNAMIESLTQDPSRKHR